MTRDLKLLIELFVSRDNVERILTRTVNTRANFYRCLIAKYQIDKTTRKSRSQIGPKVITLRRIAICFPIITCDIYHSGSGKVLFTAEQMGIEGPTSRAILTTYFTACIPFALVKKGKITAICYFSLRTY